jgi:hypothetical protein
MASFASDGSCPELFLLGSKTTGSHCDADIGSGHKETLVMKPWNCVVVMGLVGVEIPASTVSSSSNCELTDLRTTLPFVLVKVLTVAVYSLSKPFFEAITLSML